MITRSIKLSTKEDALQAVTQNKDALKYASDDLQEDEDVFHAIDEAQNPLVKACR